MMKQEYIILSIGIILILLNLYLIVNPDFSNLLGATTSGTAGATVSLVSRVVEVNITSSGNATFDDTSVGSRIYAVTGLTQGWALNLTLFGSGYPATFTERQPNSSESGPTRIEYFEIAINATTTGGSYNVFFNATQAEINISASNISLFIYESSSDQWLNVSTTIINSTSNPAQFYGTVTHFSKLFIGQKPAVEAGDSGGGSPGPSGPSGGAGGGSGGRTTVTVPPVTGGALADVLPKKGLPLKPIHIPGDLFDVSVLIPEKYHQLFPLDKLIVEISLINIKRQGSTAVKVEYTIEDAEGKSLFQSIETKVVEKEITYLKEMILPPDIASGFYLFKVRVLFGQDVAIAAFPFTVIDQPPALHIPFSWQIIAASGLIMIIIIAGALLLRWRQKRKSLPAKKWALFQLPLLKDKYQLGLIPKSVYKQQSGEIKKIQKYRKK